MLRSVITGAICFGLMASLSACAVPGIVAHGIKSYDKSRAQDQGQQPQNNPTYKPGGNSFENLPPVRAEDPNATAPIDPSGRQDVSIEQL